MNVSQTEVGDAVGVSNKTVSRAARNWEQGGCLKVVSGKTEMPGKN